MYILALLILLRIISSYERLMFGLLYSYECDICSLLSLCLKAPYLVFEGRVYQQVHGTAMGSPVSVVAELVGFVFNNCQVYFYSSVQNEGVILLTLQPHLVLL